MGLTVKCRKNKMAETPRCDFHIHTKYLKCANETMDVFAVVRECERLGVESLGFTDHLNSLDKLELHLLIRKDIGLLETGVEVYFGVELNFDAVDGNFAYSSEIKEQYGFQFAIGGIHNTYVNSYDLKKIVDIQHRHHLRTCRNPLVDVLVHPYWFSNGEFREKGWPWFESMPPVPESYARELGQTAKETGTAIELNSSAVLASSLYNETYRKEYMVFLSIIAEEGACFALGSDAHDIKVLEKIKTAWQVAEQLNLTADRIWRPGCKPIVDGVRQTKSRG
ncbi:MAG: PHP domain-containing protein [Elusimicrobiota bacterium]